MITQENIPYTADEIKAMVKTCKKYNEALEKARVYHTGGGTIDVHITETIFPELAESEDEKIRKEIINFLKDFEKDHYRSVNFSSWIVWLEKQDVNKECVFRSVAGTTIESAVEQAMAQGDVVLAFNGFYTPVKGKTTYEIVTEYDRWIKKQCEQLTDKIEPKFKVGNWISGYYTNYKVLSVNNDGYLVEDTDGNKINILFENEKFHHLWTIQDAKDGDVLHSTGFHNDCIFIFNGLDNWRFDEPNGDRAVATGHCCLSVSADKMEFGIQGPDCVEVNTIEPATKIQRDLLFQKMKEAGYEWDSEMKVVSKESEDEQMIERLKSCVYAADLTAEGREEIFAWLEKQGKKLNVDEVIDWLDYNICNAYDYDGNDISSTLKEKFIKDFKL